MTHNVCFGCYLSHFQVKHEANPNVYSILRLVQTYMKKNSLPEGSRKTKMFIVGNSSLREVKF